MKENPQELMSLINTSTEFVGVDCLKCEEIKLILSQNIANKAKIVKIEKVLYKKIKE
ncbi:hypothetical protein AAEX28_07260 [Lentisphaerota bacterium WC36G]